MPRALPPTQPFIPSRYSAALASVLEERGQSPDRILEEAGITRAALHGEGLLTLAQVEAFVVEACRDEGADRLGLAVGERLQLLSHGAISMAAATARDGRQALESFVEFFPIAMPLFTLAARSDDGVLELRLEVKWPLAPEVERFHTAMLSASLYAQLRFLLGGRVPKGVELLASHPRPEGLPPWVDAIGVALHFDQPRYALRFPDPLLSFPMPLADPHAHALAVERCRSLLASHVEASLLTAAVAAFLEREGPPFPTLGAAARAFGMSERTLRRRLSAEGSSYRVMLDCARLTQAERWLADPAIPITRIAVDLGYGDASNFARAFRRARGTTPSTYRRGR